jgi:hypothetical protein
VISHQSRSVYVWRQLASAGLGLEAGTQVAHAFAKNHELWGIWTGATGIESQRLQRLRA